VFLHGLGGNALWWAPLADLLPEHRIIALDLPGHGGSSSVDDWTVEATAVLVHDAVSRVAGGRLIFGGQSWGGKVALVLAGLYPDDVDALLLLDPAPTQGIPVPPEAFVQGRHGAELGPWLALSDANEAIRGLPQYRTWTRTLRQAFLRGLVQSDGAWAAQMTRETAIAIAQSAVGTDHSTVIAGVRCPTLLITAEESAAWQEKTNVVALPAARHVAVPGGHWIHIDNPAQCSSAIRAFLGQLHVSEQAMRASSD
jgi:pimeloyl-ACP methyl ester carboxylesterase